LLLHPRNRRAWSLFGLAAHHHGKSTLGEILARQALAIDERDKHAHVCLSLFLLAQGKYLEAWPHYEWRLEELVRIPTPPALPRWDGESPIEELVLLAEQGIGDLVQFMRYSVILRLGISKVSILAKPHLRTLLLHYGGFDEVYIKGEPMDFDENSAILPLLSVPPVLELTPEAVLIHDPYLIPDPDKVKLWKRRVRTGDDCIVVGINWQGNPLTEVGELAGRSFRLEEFAPLMELENLTFISLQKGHGSEQLQECSFRHRFVACQEEIDASWDLVETLSILSACDLVITSDTSVAHLAGALGLPTWILLKRIPDWRWGLEGETTPWYPSMRLFRQKRAGDWAELMGRVKKKLRNLILEAFPREDASL
jgi:hypothetical protein